MEGILLILLAMLAEISRLVADLDRIRRSRLVGLAEVVVAGLAALSELIQWSRKPLTHHPTCP